MRSELSFNGLVDTCVYVVDRCVFAPYSTLYALGAMPASRIEVLPRRPRASLREELRASQRGRLICAIADAVAAEGYAATSVADVIALAGVSRRTFYEHFADKESCYLAAYDSGAQAIHRAMVEAIDGLSRWEEILTSVLTTWLAFLQADLAGEREIGLQEREPRLTSSAPKRGCPPSG